MILLRALSIVIGGMLILLAPSFAVDIVSELKGEHVQPGLRVMAMALGGAALMVTGYFFVGVAGHRMGRRVWMRVLAGMLLVLPFVGGGTALLFSERPVIVWIAGPVVCFTLICFAAFVFPGMQKSSRRMRPRDYAEGDAKVEPTLSPRQR
jgi:uncharacterized membrane protein YeiB